MSRAAFEAQHSSDWRRLESLLDALESGRAEAAVAEIPGLYRRVCHHLALVRWRQYGTDIEERLNRLALRGHQRLYRRRAVSWTQVVEHLLRGFPALVRADARLMAWSLALFLLPLIATMVSVRWQPELVYSVIGPSTAEGLEAMYGGEGLDERRAGGDVMMFGFYVYNNVGIAFRTFAAGLFLGLGSAFFLVFNGLFLGAAAAHVHNLGFGATFYPFVIGHGALELPAIVIAGGAGMRLGFALLSPGRRTRGQALLVAARGAVPVIYGVAAMLVLAAFVEAFWSASALVPESLRLGVGAAAWLAVGAWLMLAGRR